MADESTGGTSDDGGTGDDKGAGDNADKGTLLHPSATDDKTGDDKGAGDNADKDKQADDKSADEAKAKEASDKEAADKKAKSESAPEAYTDFTMPEGMEMDKEALERFTPVAQEMDLNQDKAQKLVDFYAGERAKIEQAQYDAWEKTQGEWQDAVRADEEVGGADIDEKLGIANQALEKFGNKELSDALLATGAGNNVEFIRFAYRVGKAMSEDTIGQGGEGHEKPKDAASILFPNQN